MNLKHLIRGHIVAGIMLLLEILAERYYYAAIAVVGVFLFRTAIWPEHRIQYTYNNM